MGSGAMDDQISIRTLKRLTAAEGYLELELPDLALEELEGIDDAGPFDAVIDWLTGEALKGKQQYDDAIRALSKAVQGIPAPHNRRAVESLSECFRSTGQDDLADLAEEYSQSVQNAQSTSPIAFLKVELEFPGDWISRNSLGNTNDQALDPEQDAQ